jgi:hypothetical protein
MLFVYVCLTIKNKEALHPKLGQKSHYFIQGFESENCLQVKYLRILPLFWTSKL